MQDIVNARTDRLLIIGWDGADWEVLDELMARGCLSNVERMIGTGARGGLNSTIPSHSWAAWSTFLTGVNPGRHGIYDFVERKPGVTTQTPVSSDSIGAETFPEQLSRLGIEVRVANVPVTFPPIELRGRIIAGVAIPPGADFVSPASFAEELDERAPFPINGMEWALFEHEQEKLAEEALDFVEHRTASFEVLLEGDWQVATCVYVAPDRLQHAFGAYLLPSHPEYERLSQTPLAESIRKVFVALDSHIERLVSAAGPDTTVVLMSDHGFRGINRLSNLNELLRAVGVSNRTSAAAAGSVLKRFPAARRLARTALGSAMKKRVMSAPVDWSKAVAYQSVRGGGISINLQGREPEGIVSPEDFDGTREEVRELLLGFVDPATGERPVAEVLEGSGLYDGRFASLAPDLIAQPRELWSFAHTDQLSVHTAWPTGAHRRRGIVVAAGGRTVPGDLGERDIADLAATALAFCGVSSNGLDGRPIDAISGSEAPTIQADDEMVSPREAAALSTEDQEQIADHLRNLGYIE